MQTGFTGVQAQTQRLPPVRPGRATRCSVRFLQWGWKGAWRAAAAGHLLSLVLLVTAQGWLLAEPPAPGPSPRDGVAQLPGPPGSLRWAAPSLTWGPPEPLRLGWGLLESMWGVSSAISPNPPCSWRSVTVQRSGPVPASWGWGAVSVHPHVIPEHVDTHLAQMSKHSWTSPYKYWPKGQKPTRIKSPSTGGG